MLTLSHESAVTPSSGTRTPLTNTRNASGCSQRTSSEPCRSKPMKVLVAFVTSDWS